MKIELFVTPASGDGEPLMSSPVIGRRPDAAVVLSPAMASRLGALLRGVLTPASLALAPILPGGPALADALMQTVEELASAGAASAVIVIGPDTEAPAVAGVQPRGTALTTLERAILERVAAGQTDREIASELYVSRRTVQNHLARVRRKTGMRTRAELIRWSWAQAAAQDPAP